MFHDAARCERDDDQVEAIVKKRKEKGWATSNQVRSGRSLVTEEICGTRYLERRSGAWRYRYAGPKLRESKGGEGDER